MKTSLFTIAAVLMSQLASAQLTYYWAGDYAPACASRGLCVTMDGNNDVVGAGVFNGTGDFNTTAGVNTLTAPGASGFTDMYIQKVNHVNSTYMWGIRIIGNGVEMPARMIMSPTTLYVVGFFTGTVCQFDPSGVAPTVSSAGGNDIFIARYNNFGVFQGVTTIGGPGDDRGAGICIESSGNILVSGCYTGAVDFDGAGPTPPAPVSGGTEAFFARFSPTGVFMNLFTMRGAANEIATCVTTDKLNNIIVGGSFASAPCDFNPAPVGVFNMSATPWPPDPTLEDAFVARYSSAGVLGWVRTYGTPDIDQIADVCTDLGNNIYATGTLGTKGTLASGTTGDIDPLTAGVQSMVNPGTISGRSDLTILRFNPAGTVPWCVAMGGNDDESGISIGCDTISSGYVWITGPFRTATDFDGAGPGAPVAPAGGSDFYMLRYTTGGAFSWVSTVGGGNNEGAWDSYVNSVLEKIFVTGQFQGTVDFDPNGGVVNRGAPLAGGTFLAAYNWNLLPPRLENPDRNQSSLINPFPNPNNGLFAMENIPEGTLAEMYSLDGKKCASEVAATTGHWSLDFSALANGVYMLQLTKPDGTQDVRKIVIQH